MKLYCVECKKEIEARLTSGKEIYPHREDLYNLSFYICDKCKNYVGVHKGTTKPLGCIPNNAIRQIRNEIHHYLDVIWITNMMKRSEVYKLISKKLGYTYHTGNIRTIEEAKNVLKIVSEIYTENKVTI